MPRSYTRGTQRTNSSRKMGSRLRSDRIGDRALLSHEIISVRSLQPAKQKHSATRQQPLQIPPYMGLFRRPCRNMRTSKCWNHYGHRFVLIFLPSQRLKYTNRAWSDMLTINPTNVVFHYLAHISTRIRLTTCWTGSGILVQEGFAGTVHQYLITGRAFFWYGSVCLSFGNTRTLVGGQYGQR